MKKMFLGFLLAAGLFASLSYHLIITDDGIEFEKKDEFGFQHSYINTKGWSIDEYARNPEVTAILAKMKLRGVLDPKKDVSETITEESKSVVQKGAEAIRKGFEKAKEQIE